LRTTIEEAERIKKEHGSVELRSQADEEVVEYIGVATRGPRDLPRRNVCEILRARAVETLELIKDRIARSGHRDQLVAGAVITGGGSMLGGFLPLAEQILEMPVRQGLPQSLPGLTADLVHPVYATAVGLTMFASQNGGEHRAQNGKGNAPHGFINKFLSWIGS
jgi:cell division protein FtsA